MGSDVDIEKIKSEFSYCPISGYITRNRTGKRGFSTPQTAGHLHGGFMGKFYKAHRIAWVLYYGAEPCGDIDHINGVPSDNRIENLRDATRSENMMNAKMYSRNTSGKSGVSFSKGKWRVQTKLNGKWHRASFTSFDDACIFRDELFSGLGFSNRHGLSV